MSHRRLVIAAVAIVLIAAALGLGALAWQRWLPPRSALITTEHDLASETALRPWRWIVVHHSATGSGTIEGIDREHRQRGWDGIGYHFLIGNGQGLALGEIRATGRWIDQREGAHAGIADYNQAGIGICLVGDCERNALPSEQFERLAWLCANLIRLQPSLLPPPAVRLPQPGDRLAAIIGHRDVPGKATKCPGVHCDLQTLRCRVAELLAPPTVTSATPP